MRNLWWLFSLALFFGCRKEEAPPAPFEIKPTPKTKKELAYESLMKARKISFEEIGDCDESSANDTIHKKEIAYVESQSLSDTSIKANFGLVAACCKKFMGEYKTSKDTLIFTYENVTDEDCKCTCWHKYRLSIANPPKGIKRLKLVNK